MNLLTDKVKKKIENDILEPVLSEKYDQVTTGVSSILHELYEGIPDNRRISYGRVHTIKILSEYLFKCLAENDTPVFQIASVLFEKRKDAGSGGVYLGILSFCGLIDYRSVLPCFKSAASSSDWEMREHAQMFFKKLIKKYPDEARQYLLSLLKSGDANTRRFVSETLRPVQENRWFYRVPDFPLSVLSSMFKEQDRYARTSVGNNLSDLARKLPALVCDLVEELVESGNKNSYWIAYRACRNLVKYEKVKVLNLLKVDEYKYKSQIYRREEHNN